MLKEPWTIPREDFAQQAEPLARPKQLITVLVEATGGGGAWALGRCNRAAKSIHTER